MRKKIERSEKEVGCGTVGYVADGMDWTRGRCTAKREGRKRRNNEKERERRERKR